MDLDPIRVNRTTTNGTVTSTPDPLKSTPTIRVSKATTSRPTSPPFKTPPAKAKQAERAMLGLCYYCSSPAHWIADCPGRQHANDMRSANSDKPDDPDSSPFWNSDGYDSDTPSDLGGSNVTG
jgi:hypothetical protein